MPLLFTRSRDRLASLVVALSALWLTVGCTDEAPTCYLGEYQACSCGEARGLQRCDAGVYEACVCDGTIPGLGGNDGRGGNAGNGGGGGAGGAELLPFLAACEADEQCASGLCHLFAAKGQFCSKPCGSDDDCEPPSSGCNLMGICKAP